jgi:hypothetical protein
MCDQGKRRRTVKLTIISLAHHSVDSILSDRDPFSHSSAVAEFLSEGLSLAVHDTVRAMEAYLPSMRGERQDLEHILP